ncbi:hypothetical protein CIP107546_00587 [Corynebacterium diphtheriae]|nr:hypothetical protein CIP107532_00721 [Corynebacterium diphtheriae]CAB0591354.1 hypothetical protein CIP107546_00587 [Corynebacterium diphtheriae]CAB0637052.1 hypothetical protein CIP107562_00625 [Corynebacterium diphtheriae]
MGLWLKNSDGCCTTLFTVNSEQKESNEPYGNASLGTLPPTTIRNAGIIAIVQSAIGLGFAVFLVLRSITGAPEESIVYETDTAVTSVGVGTAIFFVIVFGTVIAGAIMMMRGKRWGRGPVIMLEILLLPIGFYMMSGHALLLAVVTCASAIATLVYLFSPRSLDWAARNY